MCFSDQRTRQLEYTYRKLERGLRVLQRDGVAPRQPDDLIEIRIEQLREIHKQLGRSPSIPRWPL